MCMWVSYVARVWEGSNREATHMLGLRLYGKSVLSAQFWYEFKTIQKGYICMALLPKAIDYQPIKQKIQYQVFSQVVGWGSGVPETLKTIQHIALSQWLPTRTQWQDSIARNGQHIWSQDLEKSTESNAEASLCWLAFTVWEGAGC